MKPASISASMNANARQWFASLTIACTRSNAPRDRPCATWPATGGLSQAAVRPTATDTAATARKGARQFARVAIQRPAGTPTIAASENALAISALARARRP